MILLQQIKKIVRLNLKVKIIIDFIKNNNNNKK